MTTVDSLFKAIPCTSQNEAIARAYAFSKINEDVMYYVIHCYDTKTTYIDTNGTVRNFERLVCTYQNGIKTVKP